MHAQPRRHLLGASVLDGFVVTFPPAHLLRMVGHGFPVTAEVRCLVGPDSNDTRIVVALHGSEKPATASKTPGTPSSGARCPGFRHSVSTSHTPRQPQCRCCSVSASTSEERELFHMTSETNFCLHSLFLAGTKRCACLESCTSRFTKCCACHEICTSTQSTAPATKSANEPHVQKSRLTVPVTKSERLEDTTMSKVLHLPRNLQLEVKP